MSESDNLQKLGESLRSVMGSPEFEGILKSFGAGNTNGDSAYRAGGTGAAAPDATSFCAVPPAR